MILGAYSYRIAYKSGDTIPHADGLSRLPLPNAPNEVPLPGETILLMESLKSSPVSAEEIKLSTSRDPILAQVHHMLLHGWREMEGEGFVPFQRRREELSVHDGCVLWGSRVVVPTKGRRRILELVHESHPGISRMKSLARGFVWWSGMDKDIEEYGKGCEVCQSSRHSEVKVPLQPWKWPQKPWARIHVDYAGPLGKMFLLVVDAHSKWIEVAIVNSATSSTTIERLRQMFATHGLPETMVSHNGTVFTSMEFSEFCRRNHIRHIRTAPYHPASNGQVERAVQTFKESMKRSSSDSLETRVSRFPFHYRITPHTTTGCSPAELMMGRQHRSHLSLVKQDVTQLAKRQQNQKIYYDKRTREKTLETGESVLVRNFSSGTLWLAGKLLSRCGPLSFNVELTDGRVVRRHYNHIRYRAKLDPPEEVQTEEDLDPIELPDVEPGPIERDGVDTICNENIF